MTIDDLERGRRVAAAWAGAQHATVVITPPIAAAGITILNGSAWATPDIRAIAARVAAIELTAADARRLTVVVRDQPVGVKSTDGTREGIGWGTIGSISDPVFRIWVDMPAANVSFHNSDPVQLAHTVAHEIAHCRGLDHNAMAGDNRYDYSAGWRERYNWAAALPLRFAPEDRIDIARHALRFRSEVDVPPTAGVATHVQVAAQQPLSRPFDHLRSERWDELHRRSEARKAWSLATTDAAFHAATLAVADAYGTSAAAAGPFLAELAIIDRKIEGETPLGAQLRGLSAAKDRCETALAILGVTPPSSTSSLPVTRGADVSTPIARGRIDGDVAVLHARRRELEAELGAANALIESLQIERSLDRKRIAELEAAQERTRVAFDQLRRLDEQRTDAYFGVRRTSHSN